MNRKIWMILLIVLGNSLLLFSQNCKIGDVIVNPDGSRGVVFWVNEDRTGGWMVAMEDASTGCAWGKRTMMSDLPFPSNFTGGGGQFRFDMLLPELDGKVNTQKIRTKAQSTSDWPTPYAAGVVDYDNGWYLPSAGQMRILFGNLPLIESKVSSDAGFTTLSSSKYYWTSTQNTQDYAWTVRGSTGVFYGSYYKTNTNNAVRAIRDFEMTGGFASYHWDPTDEVTADIHVAPSETTTYTVTVTMGTSCSVEDTQTITVVHVHDTVISATSCGSYDWEGDTYSVSGNYTKSLTSPEGCEYTATLHLTIIDDLEVSIVADDNELCEGESTTLHAVVQPVEFYAPGDILCTDGSIVKPSNWPAAGKTAKGIVFYVDASGRHGWAVDKNITLCGVPNDLGNVVVKWSSNNYSNRDIPDLHNFDQWRDAIRDFDGHSNTQIIRDYTNATTQNVETYPAAWSVDFENGWYIPAAGQLNILFGEILVVNASLALSGIGGAQISPDDEIWSSTEFLAPDYTYIRALKLQLSGDGGTGRIMHDEKKQKRTLRAVIDF